MLLAQGKDANEAPALLYTAFQISRT